MKTEVSAERKCLSTPTKPFPLLPFSPSPSIIFCPADRLFVAVFYFSPSISKLKKDSARLTAIPKKYFFFFGLVSY